MFSKTDAQTYYLLSFQIIITMIFCFAQYGFWIGIDQ